MIRKKILNVDLSFMSDKRTTKTNDVFKNVRVHNGIDPKDDNLINLLPMNIGNIEDRSIHII